MKYIGLLIGLLSLGFLLRFTTDTMIPRGHIYRNVADGWNLQLGPTTIKEVQLPATFEKLTHARQGARASITKKIEIPDRCASVPCFLFLGEVGDVAKVSINGAVVRTQGYADGSLVLAKHFPLWVEIPSNIKGKANIEIGFQSLYGSGFGLSKGPYFIGDYEAVRYHERTLALETVIFPLMQTLLLAILGILALVCWRLAKTERPVFFFGIFCLTEAAFSASFSLVPREFLAVTNAGATHFIIRLLADWTLFECLNVLIPFYKSVRYFFRSAFACYVGWLFYLYTKGAAYPELVRATQWAFPVIVGTPAAGLIAALQYLRINKKILAKATPELPILAVILSALTICQTWDTLLFWGFVRGSFLVKFYLAPLAMGFAIVYVLRYFRNYESLLLAKAESDKDAILGRIAVEFSHDLKSPLNSLKDCSTTALVTGDVPYMKEVLQEVVTRTATVSDRLQELFKYAREDIAEKSRTSLSNISESIQSDVAMNANAKGVKVNFALPNEDFILDETSFRRALQNVVQNAVDATPKNGVVEVSGQIINRKLVVAVKDSGTGIEESDLPRIFDPYFTKGKRGGTGLGLAIVERIVRQHGGSIKVFSKVGKGSTFVMEVPQ